MQYSDRRILVKLDTKPIDTVIHQVYMPTMDKNYRMVRTFFEERKVKAAGIKGANGNFIYEEVKYQNVGKSI